MIAEHDFVTTSPAQDAVEAASQLARQMGYRIDRCDSGAISASAGLEKPSKAKRYDELPQRLEIAFDRSRVNLAASILPKRKVDRLHQSMLTTTLELVEAVVDRGVTLDEAMDEWRTIQNQIVEQRQNEKRRTVVIVSVLVIVVVLLVTGVVFAAVNF